MIALATLPPLFIDEDKDDDDDAVDDDDEPASKSDLIVKELPLDAFLGQPPPPVSSIFRTH